MPGTKHLKQPKLKRKYLLFLLFLAFAGYYSKSLQATQVVRIALKTQKGPISIGGRSIIASLGDKKVKLGHHAKFRANNNGISINGKYARTQEIMLQSAAVFRVEGKIYDGPLEIHLQKNHEQSPLLLIHSIDLETYVAETVASEVPKSWPIEALKAQAIAVRTYAIWRKYQRISLKFHLSNTVLDQVYDGKKKNIPNARKAAKSTFGKILVFDNSPIEAYFHSTCGDKTESASVAWGKSLAYLSGKSCGFCHDSPKYRWDINISRRKLDKLFGPQLGAKIEKITVIEREKSGRAKKVLLAGKGKNTILSATELRRTVGTTRLPSTWLNNIRVDFRKVSFQGKGYGHGVGMCQWGAYGMAKRGYKAKEILSYYYPKTLIRRMY